MAGEDDDYYKGDSPFDGYLVTSTNPGLGLLFATIGWTAFCLILGMLLKCKKKKEEMKYGTSDYMSKIYNRYNETVPERAGKPGHGKGLELLDLDHSKLDLASVSNRSDLEHIEKVNFKNVYSVAKRMNVVPSRKRKMRLMLNKSPFSRSSKKLLSEPELDQNYESASASESDEPPVKSRDAMYILELKEKNALNDDGGKMLTDDNANVGPDINLSSSSASNSTSGNTMSLSSTRTMPSTSNRNLNSLNENVGGDGDYKKMEDNPEKREPTKSNRQEDFSNEVSTMLGLARPWAFSTFVVNAASIINIAVISHYIGTAEMICYSYVWFVLDAGHIISDAMFNSLYKHANNCAALETKEGYLKAGKYIKICCVCNNFISTPICVGLVFAMAPIMAMFGYGPKIMNLTHTYTIIAAVSKVISTANMYVTIIPDLDGHADFDAVYGLFDSFADIAVAMFLIPYLKPSLVQLGLIHLVQDILSMLIYYAITWSYKGWFDKYKAGICGKIHWRGSDEKMVKSLLKKTIPLTFDAITGELEWFVLTFFAAYLGAAEAATWILISHIWGFVGILPENIASASEYRVAHLLSNGQIYLAQRLSNASIAITTLSSAVCCAILFIFRDWIVDGVTQDETLDMMLLEIIPYIALGDPILAASTAASYLNRALAMYKRSTTIELLVTVLITIPLAFVSTYVFNFNIEGIAAATYVGYSTMGFFSIVVFANADWEKAVIKNKKMSEDDEEEEEDEDDIDYGQLQIGSLFNRELV